MAAVVNATHDGMLDAFPWRATTMPDQKTVTAMASVASRAGRACEQDGKNYRTNHCFSPFYPWYVK